MATNKYEWLKILKAVTLAASNTSDNETDYTLSSQLQSLYMELVLATQIFMNIAGSGQPLWAVAVLSANQKPCFDQKMAIN